MSKVEDPELLDVVWAVWPDDPKKNPRPLLVVGVYDEVERPEPLIRLAYGTSQGLDRGPRPWEAFVTNAEDLKRAGLSKPTRFDLSRTTNLLLSSLTKNGERPNLRTGLTQRKIYHAAMSADATKATKKEE